MKEDTRLRKQLTELLDSSHAHATFGQTVDDFPVEQAGVRPAGVAHSAWELLEHMRLAQEDILRFTRSADYQPMKWPDDYWPAAMTPKDKPAWAASVASFRKDLTEFTKIVNDPTRDLYKPFPWGEGQTLLRETLLIVDHNAYHLGQLMMVRRALEK
jgi:hypothetical protein